MYGIEDVPTMYRGTLRNIGWCETLDKVVKLGFLSEEPRPVAGLTYAQFMRSLLPADAADTGDLRADIATHLEVSPDSEVIKNLDWLGLLADQPMEGVGSQISPLNLLTKVMLARMEYAAGERDLILLIHHFDASYPDGKKEHITSTLIAYGEPGGHSAMARTVSLPAAIAVDLILQGEITATGVQVPVTPDLYEPILAGLEELGIECVEKVEAV
jgi:saccharopine dehydrogenase-like NADP-dependent oxidoreductase